MIEDATYRCDGCSARVVVSVDAQEQATLDGSFGSARVASTWSGGDGAVHVIEGKCAGRPRHDRALIVLPKGWDRRFGGNGRSFYHRCAECIAAGVSFA